MRAFISFVAFITIGASAFAQGIDVQGRYVPSVPERVEGFGGVWSHPSAAWMIERGLWLRMATKAETQAYSQAQDDAARAAQAAADAESKAAAEKESALSAAADYAAAKTKKEEAAKLEAVAAVAEKEPSKDDKLELLWKWWNASLGVDLKKK